MNLKKNTLLILFIISSLLLNSCTDQNEEYLSKKFDVVISVESTGDKRLSTLKSKIEGPNVTLSTSNYSKSNFPFSKVYRQQTLYEFTNITLTVIDDSSGPVGSTFTPYDIEFTVKIDNNEPIKKKKTINKSGDVVYLDYSMQELFR